MPRRRRRLWKALFGIFLVFLIGLIYAAWPGSSTFTVSPETTYVTGPLDKHGYVDYVTALNERLRGNIKPEDNANVLIWQALGPHPDRATMPEEYFQWLGIAQPPEQGEYLVGYGTYLKDHVKDEIFNHEIHVELLDRMEKAGKWPWMEEDEPELADWLRQEEKHLGLMIDATRRPDYFNPLVPKGRTEEWSPSMFGALLPSVQKCRETVALLTCRAMHRINEGKFDEAWNDLLVCHRLARLLSRGGTLIEWLVGVTVERIAIAGDVVWLERAKFTSAEIHQHWRDLGSLAPLAQAADKIDLTERLIGLQTITLVARYGRQHLVEITDGRKPPHVGQIQDRLFTMSVNWDPALQIANRWYDRAVVALRIPDRAPRQAELATIELQFLLMKENVRADIARSVLHGPKDRGEAIGNVLISLFYPAIQKLGNAGDMLAQAQGNLHLAFALAAYHADQRRYPEKLAELAPKYMDKIPDDLFSGQPLIYKLEGDGYLLYSVGVNGIDDGGRGNNDDPPGDDLVIRMPVPEPKLKK